MRFFLNGVAVQAEDAVDRAERLSDLREEYRVRLRGSWGRAPEVIDLLFANLDHSRSKQWGLSADTGV